ncbi:HD domain-containing protein [archaeon]|jgi:hypothetical protein|nr:HD domain-containing protein [archaeon]
MNNQLSITNIFDAKKEIIDLYKSNYSDNTRSTEILITLADIYELHSGKNVNYGGCKCGFHDLEHTLETTITTARLLTGYGVSEDIFTQGCIAGLLHDVGYIGHKIIDSDIETLNGGIFTKTHVERSKKFAKDYLKDKFEYTADKIEFIQNMIDYTDLSITTPCTNFKTDEQNFACCALGTADLMSQVAAPNYTEKLSKLYDEFIEGDITDYSSAEDLMNKTPGFYKFIKHRLDTTLGKAYYYLDDWQHEGSKLYFDAMEKNIAKLI